MYLAGQLIFDEIKGSEVSAVGGLTFGADPLAVAAAFASEINARPINAFSIRKTKKDHGIVRWIEGDIQPGQRVAIIDDVATTGGSTIKAIERARSEGLEVVKSVILVDRQEGGLDNIQRHVADVSCIITRDELMACWQELNGMTKDEGRNRCALSILSFKVDRIPALVSFSIRPTIFLARFMVKETQQAEN